MRVYYEKTTRPLRGFAWVKHHLFLILFNEMYSRYQPRPWSAEMARVKAKYFAWKVAVGYLSCSDEQKATCEREILQDLDEFDIHAVRRLAMGR